MYIHMTVIHHREAGLKAIIRPGLIRINIIAPDQIDDSTNALRRY